VRVAVIGVGCIGSVVASHFARAGHQVTLVARGERRDALSREGLRVRGFSDETFRLPIVDDVSSADAELILVCTQMQQVDALLSSLRSHPAAAVCLLLNAYPVPERWSETLGERLVLGFPAMLAGYRGTTVRYKTLPAWLRFVMISTLGPARGAPAGRAKDMVRLFQSVGLATTFSPNMESWLGSHSALVTPLLGFAVARLGRSMAMSWSDASTLARAMHEGLAVVKRQTGRLEPLNVAALPRIPSVAIASVFWSLSRLPWFERAVFDYAEHARDEVRAMHAGLRSDDALPNLDRVCIGATARDLHVAKEISP